AARHAAGGALREGEFLLVRLHLEKEDVAAGLARPRAAREIARADVIRDEIAGLDVQVLEIQRVTARDALAAARNGEGHGFLRAAADRVHEIHPIDRVVVFGLRLDVDLFEPRHRAIGGRLEDPDFRRPVLEHADEVLGVAGARRAFAIDEPDAIRAVARDLHRAGQLGPLL